MWVAAVGGGRHNNYYYFYVFKTDLTQFRSICYSNLEVWCLRCKVELTDKITQIFISSLKIRFDLGYGAKTNRNQCGMKVQIMLPENIEKGY